MGPRFVDRETNTSVVDIRPVDEEARVDLIHTHSIGIQMPSASSGLSLSIMNEREFIMEPCLPIRNTTIGWPFIGAYKKEDACFIDKKTTIDFWRRLS